MADVAAVASLDEPTRRRIYEHLSPQGAPVSRDEVAQALGLSRRTAAFHLDRLAGQGLLVVTFERLTGRSGPGAGRPAKLYARSGREVSVSLPPRRYDLAGSLLAGALAESQSGGEPPRDVLDRRARDLGRTLAEEHLGADPGEREGPHDQDTHDQDSVQAGQGHPGRRHSDALMNLLERHGYEPQVEDGRVVLRNCPFHALAQEHTELVCGMNLSLIEGVLDGLGTTGLGARLDPSPSRCCVLLVP